MKRMMQWALAAALTASGITTVSAQQFTQPYMSNEVRPDGRYWLPEPPKLTSGEFAYDFYYYQWGRDQREGGLGQAALYDESASLIDVFSPVLDLTLSYETTPEILQLVERATNDAHQANKIVKDHYQRVRPFATFKEASLKPDTDEEEAGTWSYPSGHSTRGYMYAMVLSTIAPEYTSALMDRARHYALNRVVCGHHWKSDTDASLLLASGIYAAVVSTDAFREQLVKAQQEFRRLKGDATAVQSTRQQPATASAAVYDLQGRRLSTQPAAPGLYIRDGQKVVTSK